jgi:hypothetical protein
MKSLLEILGQTESAKVISNDISYADYVPLDLSVTNEILATQKLATAKDYEKYIQDYLKIEYHKRNHSMQHICNQFHRQV